ncbi:MAG: aerobic carbon-monoxide dehydrogenase large subunit [Acidimicrobiaceae bacterium]|nr:aerobic carbon-monoxide dehydrogenase large subunit [Acidimicrobiaceae bacterium]
MPGSILGNAVVRVEDPDLLVGKTTFIDNLPIDGVLHLAFVRSTVAHARLLGVDVAEAVASPGVVAVYTAGDLNIPPHHAFAALNEHAARPPLATEKVRFVGDPIAVVVGETKAAAMDGAELVIVDYDPLPSVTDPEEALGPDAPLQFDTMDSNLAAGLRDPDRDALSDADVVVRGRFVNQRVAVMPMEGNAIAVIPSTGLQGRPGPGTPITCYVSTQMPHMWDGLMSRLLKLEPGSLHVIAPHVGGAFGGKAGLTSEHSVAVEAARKLDRPVKWVETRSENLVAMPHGRGQVQYVEMGFKRDGTITGLRARMVGDAGAYGGFGGGLAMGPTRSMAQGVYRIPKIEYAAAIALTNTTPMGAFRGAGRPEAAAYLERLMDMAADELGLDPADIRRRNFIGADEFPYTTQVRTTYDSGDYSHAFEEAIRLSGYEDLCKEQAERRHRGDRVQLGIGVSAYVEVTAGGGASEYGAVEIHDDGTATIKVGTSAHGQGHATSFAMIVSDRLGIPMESINFVQSDTALIPKGGGTGGSRSLQIGGNAVGAAANAVLDRAKTLAAAQLEAAVDDIVVTDDGRLGVAGVPSTAMTWAELAKAATNDGGDPLAAALDFEQSGATFPFGAHVAVVEVDMETGRVTPIRHIAVDDCGRILNPLIVTGQQHGGIAQGMAQALWEEVVFDEDGNPLTSTLADYAMPSAAEFPSFESANTETPTPLNPLGAKGIGESGTIGSTPAVQNAVVDALSYLGVRHVDMPCSPQRVWRAIEDAKAGTLPPVWREPPPIFESLPVRGSRPRPAAADVDI